MLRRRSLNIAVTLAAGTIVGLAIPHLGAVAQSSPPSSPPAAMVHIDSATLVAKGAALSVDVSVTCPANDQFPFLNLQVVERNGQGIAQGFGSTQSVPCTGSPATVTLNVPDTGPRAFKQGTAQGTATLQFCDFSNTSNPCTSVADSQTIDITK